MKRVKPKSTQRCSYCSVRAEWKTQHLNDTKFACTTHKDDLQKHEQLHQDDGHMSEADYQTWGRL
jgi:hypothetical protein